MPCSERSDFSDKVPDVRCAQEGRLKLICNWKSSTSALSFLSIPLVSLSEGDKPLQTEYCMKCGAPC